MIRAAVHGAAELVALGLVVATVWQWSSIIETIVLTGRLGQ
jgi:hypothetical protein